MDTPSGAISLARAFFRLAKYKKTGVLSVFGEKKSCRIAIVCGTPRAATPLADEDEVLGDVLLRKGKLDRSLHQRALIRGEPTGPVGQWLIESGAAPRAAVERALYEQHRSRIQRLFFWRKLDYLFVEGSADVGLPVIDCPVPLGDLILDVFRQIVADSALAQVQKKDNDSVLYLTELGRAIVAETTLSKEEAQLVALLSRGSRIEAIDVTASGSDRTRLTLNSLRLLGAVREKKPEPSCYALLLRKQRQLRNAAGPDVLLDLPKGASIEQARKALRRLAWQLHPDRFAPDASPALYQASQRVMAALCSAEYNLREQNRGRAV
ncbi:MAG: J domain-containing protein [Deltaproteobacteria bacterium]|nr:J domain-containing protein [Deltaproteobacteria bacterium]